MIKDRLIGLVNHCASSERLRYKEFEEITQIPKSTVRAMCDGRQKVNTDHLEAIADAFPQFKMWLAFGETYPEIGQVSPEIEQEDGRATG